MTGLSSLFLPIAPIARPQHPRLLALQCGEPFPEPGPQVPGGCRRRAGKEERNANDDNLSEDEKKLCEMMMNNLSVLYSWILSKYSKSLFTDKLYTFALRF